MVDLTLFTPEQTSQIEYGIIQGVDVQVFANPTYAG
jgi:hypothetical protein